MAAQRLIAKIKDELGHSPVAANAVISFVLAIVEKIVEVEFGCPCDPKWNRLFAAAFFIIPAIIAFLLMLIIYKCRFTHLSPKSVYSILPPLVWQVLVFFDGQYFVCARTYWSGKFVSVDNSYLKWCTPANSTRYLSEELLEYSHTQFVLSQGTGFGLLILLIMLLVLYIIMKCRKKDDNVL